MRRVTLVLARASNGVIGEAGRIPWHISEDLKRFKALTLNKPIVMGRKTWESLPRKPLTKRMNIVMTRDRAYAADGATVVHSLEEALSRAGETDEVMIIGGAEIYRSALALASRVELTEVHGVFKGDTLFPAFADQVWQEVAREDRTEDGLRFSYVTLRRRDTYGA